ncbi:zona pellucida sperm-binding protein 4-like isoform X2 [Osmerus eperlanus]
MTVVIKALAKGGQVEINKTVPLICTLTTVTIKEKINTVGNAPHRHYPKHCDKDGFTITINQNATVPPLNLDTVHIVSHQSPSCKPQTKTSDSVTFRFPFTSCGTQFLMDHEKVIYWVKVEAQRLLMHKQESTFRNAPFRLTVRCSYALTRVSQIGMEVYRERAEQSSALKSEGILRAEIRFAKDSSYSSFYSNKDLPVKLKLGKPVYVEVFLLKCEDKELKLRLEDCWATTSEDPLDQRRWNLLVKGCPFSGDTHRTVVLPVVPSKIIKYPSHHKWFIVKQFAFVKPSQFQQLVYFHCDVEVCKEHDCSKPCNRSRQRLERQRKTVQKYTTVYYGPLELVL